MRDAVDADLPALDLDRQIAAAIRADEIGKPGIGGVEILGEEHTDPRGGGIGRHVVVDDPESVLGDSLVIGGADRRCFDQREAGAIGADRRHPLVALAERPAEERQRRGALGNRSGPQEGIRRAGGALLGETLPALPVVGLGAERRPGESRPEIEALRRDPKRAAIEIDRPKRIICSDGGLGGGGQRIEGRGRRGIVRDRALQAARFVEKPLRQEIELGDPLGFEVFTWNSGGGCDAAGDGAADRAEFADAVLEKAPSGGGIVGEGLARGVADAGRLAGPAIDILADVVIAAEIVGALGDQEAAVILGKAGGHGRKRQKRSRERPQREPTDTHD